MKKWVLCLLLTCVACSRSYVTVQRQRVDKEMLASTFVKSPDPLREHPLKGERLIVKWRLPEVSIDQNLRIKLSVLFKDYSVEEKVYPVREKMGHVVYELINSSYREHHGLLSYKAEVLKTDNTVLRTWRQQLWVDLIELPDWSHDPELMPCEPIELN